MRAKPGSPGIAVEQPAVSRYIDARLLPASLGMSVSLSLDLRDLARIIAD